MGCGIPEQKEDGRGSYVNKKSKYRQSLNKQTNRMLRRLGRIDPENSPRKKFYRGYEY